MSTADIINQQRLDEIARLRARIARLEEALRAVARGSHPCLRALLEDVLSEKETAA